MVTSREFSAGRQEYIWRLPDNYVATTGHLFGRCRIEYSYFEYEEPKGVWSFNRLQLLIFIPTECSKIEVIYGSLNEILVCFICFWFFTPLEKFSLIWRQHSFRRKATNVELYSARIAIEQ